MQYIHSHDQWRRERLQKVTRIASAILNLDEAQLAHLIREIEDHKGRLIVRWLHPMTDAQVRAFSTAWEMCGESADSTEHIVSW